MSETRVERKREKEKESEERDSNGISSRSPDASFSFIAGALLHPAIVVRTRRNTVENLKKVFMASAPQETDPGSISWLELATI